MESLPALPPDLAAVVGSSVRGAAPLLDSAGLDDAGPLAATPFELCLALLAQPQPTGQGLPAAGKELPTAPAVAAGDGAQNLPTTELMLALAPTAAAVQAQLRPAEPPSSALAAEVSLGPTPPVGDALGSFALPLPSSPSSSSAAQPHAEAETPTLATPGAPAPLDSMAAAADVAALAPDPVDPLAADGAAQRTKESPSFDGLPADDQRFEPSVAQRPELRANVAPALPQAAALPQYQAMAAAATPTAEVGAVVQSAARRVELQQAVQAAGESADGARVPFTDWLPSAGASANPTHAVTAPTQAAAGTPVDTRGPAWQEAFASRVQWLVDHDVGEAHIKLNPPELGAVDVKISLVDDKTFVQLTTATVGARDELQHSLPRLRELFAGSGLELGGASVQSGRDGQQHAYGDGPRAGGTAGDGRDLGRSGTATHEPRTPLQRPSLGRIDLFA